MTHEISFPGLGLSFTVDRAAFWIFGIPIYWYGLLIAAGLLLAICYGLRTAKRSGLDQDHLMNMILLAVPAAIVCARLYYVVFSWDMYRDDPLSVLDIRGGGLAIYGGVIGACIAVFGYCKARRLALGPVLDLLAVGLLIGQSIGRWGNFVNGEAYGGPCALPWAMTIAEDGRITAQSVHPAFLYESLWNFAGIGVLLLYKRVQRFPGELFCAYLTWYGLGRVWIEGLRADSLYIGNFRVSQVLAGVTVLLGMALILRGRIRSEKESTGGSHEREKTG